MTVNRSIFGFIKSPALWLFIGGFMLAFLGFLAKAVYTTPLKSQCVSPVSFYVITDDDNVTLTRGVYRSYRDGMNQGRITFIGSISRFIDAKLQAPPMPVQREVQFRGSFSGNLLRMTITGHHRRLGDRSDDKEVTENIFPQINQGETGNTSLYLLDGKVLATGTETVARVACIN
jgi:hypothetical protein